MQKSNKPKQAADKLSCSVDQIRALIAAGEIRAINVGLGAKRARWIILDEEIDAFLQRRSNKPAVKAVRRKPKPTIVGNWV